MAAFSDFIRWVAVKSGALTLEDFPEFLRAQPSKSGVSVNWSTALSVTTVLAVARVLAEGVSQVPLKVFMPRAGGKGADPATDNPIYDILYRRPNPWQTSFEFRETLMFHLVMCFNAYAYKNFVGGELKELIPIEPNRVFVRRHPDMSLTYTITMDNGQTLTDVPQNLIWHLRGPSWNSWYGLDAVKMAREAIGLAVALEGSQASLQKNGVQPSGAYSVEGKLDAKQHTQMMTWLEQQYAGNLNSGKPMVLDRAAKWMSTSMTGKDAQSLEQRQFQVEEICRGARVFPQMVGHNGNTSPTFASAEQFFIAHVVHTLGPWFERIEQSIDVNLLGGTDLYAKHNVTALLRGDNASRAAFYEKALGGARPETAWMVKNEVRGLEEMNPVDGGDEFPQAVIVPPKAPDATPEPGA
jgi:HK97 family phage portal protein